jgi:hypothetical protein
VGVEYVDQVQRISQPFNVPIILTVGFTCQYEFLKQISADPNNIVVGTVRDKASMEKKLAADGLDTRPNIHIVHAELTDYASLKVRTAEPSALSLTKANEDPVPELRRARLAHCQWIPGLHHCQCRVDFVPLSLRQL